MVGDRDFLVAGSRHWNSLSVGLPYNVICAKNN